MTATDALLAQQRGRRGLVREGAGLDAGDAQTHVVVEIGERPVPEKAAIRGFVYEVASGKLREVT